MSLNRCEQQLFDYVQRNPDERHYWTQKVRALTAAARDGHEASIGLDSELWRYLEERSRNVHELREYGGLPKGRRMSLRNLADHLIRLWGAAAPKAKRADDGSEVAPYA